MMLFNGPEYKPEFDDLRLLNQIDRVKRLMLDGRWRTLQEIEYETKDPQASISAQLRHLRKSRFGSFVVERRPKGERVAGLFEYRIQPPGTVSEFALPDRKSNLRLALEAIWKHQDTTEAQKQIILSFMNKRKKEL